MILFREVAARFSPKRIALFLFGHALGLYPASYAIARVADLGATRLSGYWFFTIPSFVAVIPFSVGWLCASRLPRSVRFALGASTFAYVGISLWLETDAWSVRDAQAGLHFLFAPLYASVLAMGVGVLAWIFAFFTRA